MSSILSPSSTPAAMRIDAPAFFYTICPVLVASNLAVDLGYLNEAFSAIGVTARYLRSLENNAGWLAHYRHSVSPTFRDGGAITTIWARAAHASTTLIASTATQTSGQIVVRADTPFESMRALAGKRIALPKTIQTDVIDFSRAIAQQGILQALRLNKLTPDDVVLVDIALDSSVPVFAPAANPTALWQQISQAGKNKTDPEVAALRRGTVDAIFSYPSRAERLVHSGEFRIVEDLTQSPNWEDNISNGPYTMAIDTDFARTHPDIVVAFLRAVIRAGQWINTHRDEAAQRFTRMTYFSDAALIRRIIGTQDFVPNLSHRNLEALTIQKDFLHSHGYLPQDINIQTWADHRYLDAAVKSLA